MSLPIDRTGQRYGCLTALERHGKRWLCQCDCGKQKSILTSHLVSGATRSCGHLISDATRKRCTKHGRKTRASADPTYSSWCAMWTRCTNPNQSAWANYGGRGIKVCDRWKDFEAFLQDMGPRPNGGTLDRLDVDGDYGPENCAWVTRAQQNRNKRNSIRIEHNGETLLLAEWAERLGLPYGTLYNRLYRYGWSVDAALCNNPPPYPCVGLTPTAS